MAMRCKKCGNEIVITDNYCDCCGTKIIKNNSFTPGGVNSRSKVSSNSFKSSANSLSNGQVFKEDKNSDTGASVANSYNNDIFSLNNSIGENDSNKNIFFEQPTIQSTSNQFDFSNVNPEPESVKNNNFQQLDISDSFSDNSSQNETNNCNGYVPKSEINITDKRVVDKKMVRWMLGICSVFVVAFFILTFILFSPSNDLVCTADEGSITIKFNNDGEIIAYNGVGIEYDYSTQASVCKKIGKDDYISQFNDWFVSNTSGYCSYKGTRIDNNYKNANGKKSLKPEKIDFSVPKEAKYKTITIGDDNYGYLDIPDYWVKFDGGSESSGYQYTYANTFIVTLDKIDSPTSSAKEYARNYANNMREESNVTDVSTAIVKVGENSEFKAYQVSMYYVKYSRYLITYWFEDNSGKVRYLALEGPDSSNSMYLTDFLGISLSYRLKK